MTRRHRTTVCRTWWRRSEGQVTAFVVVLTAAILAVAGLSLDGGLALATKVRASDQAESAARVAAQAVDLTGYRRDGTFALDPVRAVADAEHYLAGIGATGAVTVTQDSVTVTVTTTRRTQLLGLTGVDSLTVHAAATARLQRGIADAEPPPRGGPP